jgi:hypothetical protein
MKKIMIRYHLWWYNEYRKAYLNILSEASNIANKNIRQDILNDSSFPKRGMKKHIRKLLKYVKPFEKFSIGRNSKKTYILDLTPDKPLEYIVSLVSKYSNS